MQVTYAIERTGWSGREGIGGFGISFPFLSYLGGEGCGVSYCTKSGGGGTAWARASSSEVVKYLDSLLSEKIF